MKFIYNFILHITWYLLRIVSLFNAKINLFVNGRKHVFGILESSIQQNDKIIWIHAASLGEYEQGLPVIQKLRTSFEDHKILVTFFSPSGYEVKKNSKDADIIVYMPLDTKANARRFITLVNPEIAIFVKYEIWPNHLSALNEKQIPTILISAVFNKRQVYFKWYGGMMRKALRNFSHFFVQNQASSDLLNTLGFNNITLSGDTRFDRVYQILERDNHLKFMDDFKGNETCFVAGSTWPEDEKPIISFINSSDKRIKYVLAPHNIKADHIERLQQSISKPSLLFSEINNQDLNKVDVLIIDTIGLLTKIYSYADLAYVGGGFKTGLHNTLEPAVFGIPVIIGPEYKGFIEAEALVEKKGLLPIKSNEEFSNVLNQLINQPDYMVSTGNINSDFIQEQKGASLKIMHFIKKQLISIQI